MMISMILAMAMGDMIGRSSLEKISLKVGKISPGVVYCLSTPYFTDVFIDVSVLLMSVEERKRLILPVIVQCVMEKGEV